MDMINRKKVLKATIGFNPAEALDNIMKWLEQYKKESNMKKAIIGISGGKDSTVVAKILVDSLGKDNVYGVLMPNGNQSDIDDSIRVAEMLGIKYVVYNIGKEFKLAVEQTISMCHELGGELTDDAIINIAPRIRMKTLYSIGQSLGCRVAGTGNLSEKITGYFTKWGDGANDFNIIGNLTAYEVMRVGEELGLPLELVYKTPADGLTEQSDEEKLGFTYEQLHYYSRDKSKLLSKSIEMIDNKVKCAQHKLNPIPVADKLS